MNVNPHDPARPCSGYALIATPAEHALRADLRSLLLRAELFGSLRPNERERIAAKIRASQAAAFKYDFEVPDVQ